VLGCKQIDLEVKMCLQANDRDFQGDMWSMRLGKFVEETETRSARKVLGKVGVQHINPGSMWHPAALNSPAHSGDLRSLAAGGGLLRTEVQNMLAPP
jgi:hypothetical protein